jgi:hypothetical protein
MPAISRDAMPKKMEITSGFLNNPSATFMINIGPGG